MNQNRVTKIFNIDMGHRLPEHEGLCKNVHGHSYKIEVTFSHETLSEKGSDSGMVLDFKVIKDICGEIFDRYDHAYVGDEENDEFLKVFQEKGFKTVGIKGAPTAENMARNFFGEIDYRKENIQSNPAMSLIRQGIEVESVTVWETPTSFATYSLN